MRSYISKSMMLGLALAAMTGCSTSGDKGSDSSKTGSFKANVVFPNGRHIDYVNYNVTCTSGYAKAGTWDVTNSTKISGVVGGMNVGDNCSISLSAKDDTVPASTDLTSDNCHAAAYNVAAVAAKSPWPSTTNLNLVCIDQGVSVAGQVGSLTGLASVTFEGQTHMCSAIQVYTASPGEVTLGHSINLDVTAIYTSGTTGYAWTAESPSNSNVITNGGTASATYTCNTPGTFALRVAVLDSYATPTGTTCGSNSDTFQVQCTDPGPDGGVGGAGGTGGTTTTGGTSETGGTTTTGGTSETGGTDATGGTTSAPPTCDSVLGVTCAADHRILFGKSADCLTCAQANCGAYIGGSALQDTANGVGSCTMTAAKSGSTFSLPAVTARMTTTTGPYPLTIGTLDVPAVNVCLDVLQCIISTGCAAGGNATPCFCGSAVGSDCTDADNFMPRQTAYFSASNPAGTLSSSRNPDGTEDTAKTGPIDGACWKEEINGRNSVTPANVSSGFGDVTRPLGPANQLVTCLATSSCKTTCL